MKRPLPSLRYSATIGSPPLARRSRVEPLTISASRSPIVVVVEERGAVAVGVNDEVLGGASGDVEEIEARLGGDIHEPDRGALRAGRADPQRCDQGGRAEPGDR